MFVRPAAVRSRVPRTTALALVFVAIGFAARADPAGDPGPTKDRRGVLVRVESILTEGDGGWVVAMESIAESGKTAEFDDSIGVRIGADLEVHPRVWLRASVGRAEPVLEITTLRPSGEPDLVQHARVSMTPVLFGVEFRSRDWRKRTFTWGMGAQVARVFYGSLPPKVDAELESAATSWGFNIRLDVRVAKSRWLAGVEFGALLPGPSMTDRATGRRNTAHFGGIVWAVGVAREF